MSISGVDAVSNVGGAYRVYFHLDNLKKITHPVNSTHQNVSPNIVKRNPHSWQIGSFYSIYNFLINNQEVDKSKEIKSKEICHSCQGRQYVCSNGETSDGISTIIPGRQSELRVQHHEAQHLHLARIKAVQEGKIVVSQHIHLQHTICSECGGTYVSGGQAITHTLGKEEFQKLNPQIKPTYQSSCRLNDEKQEGKGINVDFYG